MAEAEDDQRRAAIAEMLSIYKDLLMVKDRFPEIDLNDMKVLKDAGLTFEEMEADLLLADAIQKFKDETDDG